MIKIIVAVNPQKVIGKDNQIPWFYKEDLAFFKQVTMGHVVIMGRKTWDSLPPKMRPLPGRVNIVVSSQNLPEAATTATSLAEAISFAQTHHEDKEIFLIGGARIYEEGMNYAQEILMSRVPDILPDEVLKDCIFFPPIPSVWTYTEIRPHPLSSSLFLQSWCR